MLDSTTIVEVSIIIIIIIVFVCVCASGCGYIECFNSTQLKMVLTINEIVNILLVMLL